MLRHHPRAAKCSFAHWQRRVLLAASQRACFTSWLHAARCRPTPQSIVGRRRRRSCGMSAGRACMRAPKARSRVQHGPGGAGSSPSPRCSPRPCREDNVRTPPARTGRQGRGPAGTRGGKRAWRWHVTRACPEQPDRHMPGGARARNSATLATAGAPRRSRGQAEAIRLAGVGADDGGLGSPDICERARQLRPSSGQLRDDGAPRHAHLSDRRRPALCCLTQSREPIIMADAWG
jgi:hypothetical protein